MTKFDHRSQLPKIFRENNLSILPTSRGFYEIGTFDTFHDFDKDDAGIASFAFPTHLESLDYQNITSESIAVNCAFVSGILHDFTGEEELLPTVCGRMSSSLFDFRIRAASSYLNIQVDNSQIEIDAGYEGRASLCLIEAKNYISDDFLIRQLYYPYRLWRSRIKKPIRPIFLTYSNGIFHLREYQFTDDYFYNSIRLLAHKKYTLQKEKEIITRQDVQSILGSTAPVDEPDTPFPQADSFERVINLCELLKQRGFLSKTEITRNYDFDPRQTDYYSNAAKYLGLAEKVTEDAETGWRLTPEGSRIFELPFVPRQLEFVRLILRHKPFSKTLRKYLATGSAPAKQEIIEIMKTCRLHRMSREQTYARRASTVISWVNWILALTSRAMA